MDIKVRRGTLRALINAFGKTEFVVEFVKRTDNTKRVMRCTTNYKDKLVGGTLNYNAREKDLLPVWDIDQKGFRSIPLDRVLVVKTKRNTFIVKEGK